MADGTRSLLIKFLGDASGLKSETASVKTSLGSIKQSISDAEGASGKFKAGVGGAFQYAKDHAGQMAMAGGAALVAFGVKAVGAFVDTAKAAIDFGGATGLAVEDASRWIAVGDDFGVSAEQLSAGVGKIAKSLDDTKWAEYGVATRTASGEARDANDILADSLAMLSQIENGTERARVGNELFGKGYKALAPMIGHTRDEYEQMLGAVEAGQVVTDGEAKKAERMRLAQDALADALQEVTLATGEFVASLAPVIEGLADTVSWATRATGALLDIPFGLGDATREMKAFAAAASKTDADMADVLNAFSDLVTATGEARSGIDKTEQVMGAWGDANARAEINLRNIRQALLDIGKVAPEQATQVVNGLRQVVSAAENGNATAQDWVDTYGLSVRVVDDLEASLGDMTIATGKQAAAADAAADAEVSWEDAVKAAQDAAELAVETINDMIEARQELISGALSSIDAEYAYMQQVRDSNGALEAYNAEVAEGLLTADELASKTEAARLKMVDVATTYADVSGQAEGTTGYIAAMIESLQNQATTLDPSSPLLAAIQGYIDRLLAIPGVISTEFRVKGADVVIGGKTTPGVPKFDDGGVMPGPRGVHGLALVAGGETVVPTHKGTGIGGGLTVIVEGSIVGDAGVRQLFADALAEWERMQRGNR